MNKFLSTIIITLFLCLNAFAQQTVISGLKITKPVTWSGTVIIEGDVTVAKNGRLTIAAGTKVLFKPQTDKTNSGNDKTRSELIVKGTLVVKGQMERKVTFSSLSKEPRMGDWYGIYIGSPKQISIIDYAIIEYGYNGIMIKKSNPVIRNSQIRLNYNAGISCEVKSEAKITKNIISENGYGGIICALGARPVLSHNLISLNQIGVVALSLSQPNLGSLKKDGDFNQGENNIFENSEYDLYNHTNLPLLAENNSWGNSGNLNSRIYDSEEDAQYGIVDFSPVYRQSNLDELLLVAQETPDIPNNAGSVANNAARSVNNTPAAGQAIQQTVSRSPNNRQSLAAAIPVKSTPPSNIPADTEEAVNDSAATGTVKEAEGLNAPAMARIEDERPLAALEQQPVMPQINYDQIFFEQFLDSGSKKIVKKVAPRIAQFGPRGRVIVRAVVGKDGKVETAKVVKGLVEQYDQICLSAAEQFEFSTGRVKGIPVKFYTNILFEF